MPSRILRDYIDSPKFDGISAESERLFIRLLTRADDYGRYHADLRLLKAGCYPLHDNIRTNDLTRWLDELSTRQLIFRYDVGGRGYLAIVKFGQRLRDTRAKFPQPAGESSTWLPICGNPPQSAATCRKLPPDSEAESSLDSDSESSLERAVAPGVPPKRERLTEGFAEFWQAYPKKMAKADAERAWTAKKCHALLPTILAKLAILRASHDWTKEGGQFAPYPATWLNREGWHDELPAGNGSRSIKENIKPPIIEAQ